MSVSAQFGSALKNQVFFLEWSDGPGPNSRKRGTGFFISPTIALTAYHNTVREDPDSTIEGQYGDSKITFRRVLAESAYELAVLEIVKATPPLPDIAFERCVSLPLSDADTGLAWAGHAVSVVGYPREANFAKRSIQGHISHDAICNTKRATNGEFRDWVPSAIAVRPDREGTLAGLDGMSGAPLYDFEHQAIVGVVFGIQNRMYATQFAHLVERWTEAKRYITETAAPPTLRFVAPSWSSSTIADSPHPYRRTWRAIPALALAALIIAGGVYGFLGTQPKAAVDLKSTIFTQLTDQPGAEASPSFSPDGLSFVYPSQMSGNWNIYLQRVGGKTPIPLTKGPTDDLHPAFAPNGEQIAFRSERDGGGIFVMGATGEFVRRLTDFGYNPAWSPDGKQVVFCSEAANHPVLRGGAFKSQLWVVNTLTAEKRQLTKPTVVADAVQPNWSPSGARIAYWALKGSQRDLWTVSADGTDPVAVTDDSAVDSNPVWSPDGRHLYFVSDRGGSMNLWRVPIDQESGKTLGSPEAITTPSPFVGSISISHDGKKIVFASRVLNSNIHIASFDPTNEMIVGQIRPITRGSRQALYPDISPDDDRLVFHDLSKNQDVFVVKVDGTELQQLTNDIYGDRHARWSPDGKRIAFRSNHDGKMDIWLIKPDGSSLQRLTYTSASVMSAPVWSPDSQRLFYSISDANPFVIEVAKSGGAQSPKALSVPKEPKSVFEPWSWSPDGTKLAGQILRADSANSSIGVYSLKSGKLDRLTEFGGSPRWMQDNRRLLFQDAARLYVIDSRSGRTREILSIAPHSFSGGIALSRDNRSIYFDITETEADIWLATLQ